MALLGVIGGLGPMATAYFMELITSMTDAECDQEHMRMLVYSIPDTPDRTSFILGRSQASPLPNMLEAGRALKSLGVDVIAVPRALRRIIFTLSWRPAWECVSSTPSENAPICSRKAA